MNYNIKEILPFYDYLTQIEKDEINNHISIISYKKGENIFSPIKECLGVVVVKTGSLRAYLLSDEGREITLFKVNDLDFCIMTASCVLNSSTLDIFVDALYDTEIYLLNINYFKKLVNENKDIENFTLKCSVEKYAQVLFTMEQLLFMSLDKRFSLYLIDKYNENQSLEIKVTHDEIAKELNSAREVVTRIIKHFVEDDLIVTKRGSITINNLNRLKCIIE